MSDTVRSYMDLKVYYVAIDLSAIIYRMTQNMPVEENSAFGIRLGGLSFLFPPILQKETVVAPRKSTSDFFILPKALMRKFIRSS